MDHLDWPGDVATELARLRQARDQSLQAARAAVRDASRVNRILTVLSEPAPLESMLEQILATVSELFSADVVVLMDPAGRGDYSPVASIGLPEGYRFRSAAQEHIAPLFQTHREGTVIGPEMLRANPVFHELSQRLGVAAAAWVPMQGSRELRGALILARCTPAPFTREELGLLTAMAYRIALTLEQIQNRNQLERIIRETQKIGHQLEEPAIEEEAVRAFPAIVAADAAALFHCEDDCPVVCASNPGEVHGSKADWSCLAKLLRTDKALLRGEAVSALLTPGSGFFPAGLADFRYRAVLAAPLFHAGRLRRLLCAFRSNAVDFSLETKQIVTLYSGQIAAALENAHLYAALRDELRERLSIEAFLRESEERYKALVSNISNVIAVLNSDGTIKYVGEAAARSLWGRTAEELVGTTLLDRAHPDDLPTLAAVIEDALRKPGTNISTVVRMRDGEAERWRYFDVILTNLLPDSSVKGIVATFHDVTEGKIVEKELTQLALRDSLTGLPNRAGFFHHVRFALKLAEEQGTRTAIIFFDLDNFKSVNDKFGHAVGDETLRIIANRVTGCLRDKDVAARLGGDEFTILIENIDDSKELTPVLDRLLAALMEPVQLNGIGVKVGGSIGIAISRASEDDAESLLHKADLAMYRAKNSGKGRYVVYEPSFAVKGEPST